MVDKNVRGRAAASKKRRKKEERSTFQVGHIDVKGHSNFVSTGSVFSQDPGSEQGVSLLTSHTDSMKSSVNNKQKCEMHTAHT